MTERKKERRGEARCGCNQLPDLHTLPNSDCGYPVRGKLPLSLNMQDSVEYDRFHLKPEYIEIVKRMYLCAREPIRYTTITVLKELNVASTIFRISLENRLTASDRHLLHACDVVFFSTRRIVSCVVQLLYLRVLGYQLF